jgi:chromosome segregation ATPase
MEMRIEELKEKIKEAEDLTDSQTKKEDDFDERVRKLSEEGKDSEVRAEFAERTVEKLESTIDGLEEALYDEKLRFRDISLKLDQTLRDMMDLQ